MGGAGPRFYPQNRPSGVRIYHSPDAVAAKRQLSHLKRPFGHPAAPGLAMEASGDRNPLITLV